MLRELGDKIERIEDLEIPLRSGRQVVTPRVGEGTASILLRLIDDLPALGHLDQPREAERAARHVLHQTLNAREVACGQKGLDRNLANC